MKLVDIHPKIMVAYSTIEDGNIDYRFGSKEEVRENRKQLFKELKLNALDVIEGQQIHFKRLLSLDYDNAKMWRGTNITGVDGLLTDQKDIAFMLRVADCIPLVLFDPIKHATALIHVGWKGAVLGIHTDAVAKMISDYHSQAKDMIAWLGPSAQACCYLSPEEPEQIHNKAFKPYIKKKTSGWQVDLPAFVTDSLKQVGVLRKNTLSDPNCTIETDWLFSHQRSQKKQQPEGRFAVLVKLK